MAPLREIEVVQGDQWARRFVYYNPLPDVTPPQPDTNNPINITGLTVTMSVRSSTRTPPVLVLTDGHGLAIDRAAGQIDATITDTQLAGFVPGRYTIDLVIDKVTLLTVPFIVRARGAA